MKNLIIAILVSFFFFSSCLPVRSLFLAAPDKKDLKRFPANIVEASNDCFEFALNESQTAQKLMVNDWTTDIPFFVDLPQLAKTHELRSMLLIQKDSILFEYYGNETSKESLNSSYSIAKSFTSALIGIAIEEGHIKSAKDYAINYIPELKDIAQAEFLTVEHLLNHTSGIKYRLDLDATIYYGKDILKGLKKIAFVYKPGTKQHYLNINIQLLGLILKRATNQSPAKYLEEKIWKPIGMCSNGTWSKDKRNDLELTYCCLGATALDYAKFGRLYLNEGMWGKKQIISKAWYNKSIRRDTLQGSSYNYNYSWHIGLKEYGDFMAIGLYKQHIYINPKKDLILVVLNNKENKLKAERVNWWYVFRQIADQL